MGSLKDSRFVIANEVLKEFLGMVTSLRSSVRPLMEFFRDVVLNLRHSLCLAGLNSSLVLDLYLNHWKRKPMASKPKAVRIYCFVGMKKRAPAKKNIILGNKVTFAVK